MAALAPFFDAQFFDDAGVPAAGFRLHTYETGTTTPKDSYTDQGGAATNTNPILLDAAGRCSLWLGDGEYALELRDPDAGALVARWDNVGGIPAASSDEFVPIAGGVTMTGRFNLAGSAQASLQPVTLQQMTDAIAEATNGLASDSDVSSAVTINLPPGVIVLWSGSVGSVPAGWKLCDGTNGTPDLRNRFVIGAGSTYSPGNTGGNDSVTSGSAGAHSHTVSIASHMLTLDEIPSHKHGSIKLAGSQQDIGDPGTYVITSPTQYYGESVIANSETGNVGGGQGHTHTGSADAAAAHAHTVATMPPYYALAYIMKAA